MTNFEELHFFKLYRRSTEKTLAIQFSFTFLFMVIFKEKIDFFLETLKKNENLMKMQFS